MIITEVHPARTEVEWLLGFSPSLGGITRPGSMGMISALNEIRLEAPLRDGANVRNLFLKLR